MTSNTAILRTLAAAFLLLCLQAGHLRASCGFTLLRSDESGVALRFNLPDWELVPVDAGGRDRARIVVRCAQELMLPGYPVIPQFKALVAVPPGARVRASWNASQAVTVGSGPLVTPLPADNGAENGPAAYPSYSTEFLEAGIFPAEQVMADGPRGFRGLELMEVYVRPFVYDHDTGRLRISREIDVSLEFSRPAEDGFQRPRSFADPLALSLCGTVINSESARGWIAGPGKVQSPSLAAEAAFGDGEQWFRIGIAGSGMYAITGAQLASAGAELSGIDPASLRLYSGGGRMLPEDPEADKPSLEEVAIEVRGAQDNSLDQDDMIVFFGRGLDRFTWDISGNVSSIRHRYDGNAVYWLTWGGSVAQGRRMGSSAATVPPGAEQFTHAEIWRHHELNTTYLSLETPGGFHYIAAPDYWAWVSESDTEELIERWFSIDDELDPAGGHYFRMQFYDGGGFTSDNYRIFLNSAQIGGGSVAPFQTVTSQWYSLDNILTGGENRVQLRCPDAKLGFFEIRTRVALGVPADSCLLFHETGSPLNPVFRISSPQPANLSLYDLTVPGSPLIMQAQDNGDGTASTAAQVSAYQARTFAAVDGPAGFLEPVEIRAREPAGLRSTGGAEYLVIAPRELMEQAARLVQHRSAGYSARAVAVEDICDEFSYGPVDPGAVRDFLQYATVNWQITPQYAVFLGDGHNDFRGYTAEGASRKNYIVPYITTDDIAMEEWFARFEQDGLPQLSLGRIPAGDRDQAAISVEKIICYETGSDPGDWVQRLVLVADDGYVRGRNCDNVQNHVPGSEHLDSLFPRELVRRKIYLDSYQFDPPEIGTRKPGAARDLIELWNSGALVVSYLGHGSELYWAQERVWDTERDLPLLANGYRLPFVLNSSCSIGHFDSYRVQAMAERLVTHQGGGAIAALAGTRVTFASQNLALSRLFVSRLFEGDPTVGEAHLAARTGLGALDRGNAERYAIFGDPALKLHRPRKRLVIGPAPGTELKAGARVEFTGRVEDAGGTLDNSFSGVAEIKFLGLSGPVDIAYQCRSGSSLAERSVRFARSPSLLFSGPVTVSGGVLSGAFVLPVRLTGFLPEDSLDTGSAHFTGYATSESMDAAGAGEDTPFLPGIHPLADSTGPEIRIFSGGRELSDGERVSTSDRVEIVVEDESGINTTGRPGEQLTLEVDDGLTLSRDLTPLFGYDRDSYTVGRVSLELSGLEEGLHSFRFRAVDNALNPGRTELMLNVAGAGGGLVLSDVINYPNPFSEQTSICFEISSPADVLVRIYSVAGRPVKELHGYSLPAGYHMLDWDGRDEYNQRLANGVYLYKIVCKSLAGPDNSGKQEVEATGKALLSR